MKVIYDVAYLDDLKLDLYIPDQAGFKTIISFHGGGLVEGDKSDVGPSAVQLVELGYGVASVNYSLYPNAKFPQYIKEAASAVKFVYENIKQYGGSKELYITGHSAGAYLTMMLCLNKEYLEGVGLSPLTIKGYISDSGQMSDHFHVQQFEKGLDPWLQRITEYAPLYYVSKDIKTSSILLIWYSDDMLCRKEQNILLLKSIKFYNPEADIDSIELEGGHCSGCYTKDEDGKYTFVKVIDNWIRKH